MTSDSCGVGHAVRGIALVEAAERYNAGRVPTGAQPSARDTAGSAGGDAVRLGVPVLSDTAGALSLRAFGPVVAPLSGLPRDTHRAPVDLEGYEGSNDWHARVLAWQPDLLLGDLRPSALDLLRVQLGCPSWLLMRIWPGEWRGAPLWSRVAAIEPGVDPYGVSEVISPIVGRQRIEPEAGTELHAGYGSWWEAAAYGYRERVRWIADGIGERQARIRQAGAWTENGADVLVRMAAERLLTPV